MYAFVIFYYATVFNYIGKGPLWKVVAGADSEDCKNNWWANLLYINNYVKADHMVSIFVMIQVYNIFFMVSENLEIF